MFLKNFWLIVMLLIVGISAGCSDKEKGHSNEKTPKNLNLGLTFNEFRRLYSVTIPDTRFELKAVSFISKNGKDEFSNYFGDTVGLYAEIDPKNNFIRELAVFSEPDKGKHKGKDALLLQIVIFDSVIGVFSPEISEDERKKLLSRLSKNLKSSAVMVGDVIYTSTLFNGFLTFSVRPRT